MRTCRTNVEIDNVWRLSVEGPCLDAVRIEELRNALQTVISSGARGVVIDFARIDRLDPLGLAGLAMLPRNVPIAVRVVLASLRPHVQETVMLVHLHDILDIYEDVRAAAFDLSTQIGSS